MEIVPNALVFPLLNIFPIGASRVVAPVLDVDQMGEWSLKSSNISGNIGIGATVFSKLQITANYNFQLSKSGEVKYINENGDEATGKMKFNSWQLGLGYYF